MKKTIYSLLLIVGSALVFGVIGLFKFAGYGGGSCDVAGRSCDCFCCNMFGLRGYESCGNFGLLAGIFVGGAFGFMVYKLIRK